MKFWATIWVNRLWVRILIGSMQFSQSRMGSGVVWFRWRRPRFGWRRCPPRDLTGIGFREFRVRHLGETARLEIHADELERALEPATAGRLEDVVRKAGFRFVTIDPEPFRSGRLNEVS